MVLTINRRIIETNYCLPSGKQGKKELQSSWASALERHTAKNAPLYSQMMLTPESCINSPSTSMQQSFSGGLNITSIILLQLSKKH